MRAQQEALLLPIWTCFIAMVQAGPLPDSHLDLLMHDNKPTKPDTYSCLPFEMDKENPTFITGFIPHATMDTAHHILIYGCEEAGKSEGVWNCGEMSNADDAPVCKKGAQIIYAWARDAPALSLPKDVAFKVGGSTKINWLVLQVHYMNVTSFLPPLDLTDNSGISLVTTEVPQPKRAGTYLLGTGGGIPPHSNISMETACQYTEDLVMHPFAFRTHTHMHGVLVDGYRVRDGEWDQIGSMDPQQPQMFYNVTDPSMTIQRDDFLAARCLMVNNEDHRVEIGMTHDDEMCNFYVMYYVDGHQLPQERDCFKANAKWSKVITSGAPGESSQVTMEQETSEGNMSEEEQSALEAYIQQKMDEMRRIEEEEASYNAMLEQEFEKQFGQQPSWMNERSYDETPEELYQRSMRGGDMAEDYYPYESLREYYDNL